MGVDLHNVWLHIVFSSGGGWIDYECIMMVGMGVSGCGKVCK